MEVAVVISKHITLCRTPVSSPSRGWAGIWHAFVVCGENCSRGVIREKTVDGVRKRWIGMQGWIWTGFKHPKLGAAALAPEPTAEGKKQKSFALLGLSWGSLRQQGSESCMQSLQAELLSMGDKTCRLALFDNSINVVRDRQVGV